MFSEMLEATLQYHGGDMKQAKREVIDYMDSVKKALSETEKEFFDEKAGAFINDGYTIEEADAVALDMIIKKRPAQEKPPQTRKTREGLIALEYIMSLGIKVNPCKKGTDGRYYFLNKYADEYRELRAKNPKAKISDCSGFTSDINRVKAYMEQGIEVFRSIPKDYDFLWLDVDNKDGKDGTAEFYSFCEKAGKPRHLLPVYLQGLPQSYPCFVSSPSGNGYHLPFKCYCTEPLLSSLPNAPAVEVKYGADNLTAPGSAKDGKPYVLHGELENAPRLPAFILTAIKSPKLKPAAYTPYTYTKKEWGKPSWEKIREWTEADGAGAGRNDRAFSLARHARNHKYTEAETIDALRREPSLNGLPENEIKTAVHSAFSRGKTA